MTLSLDSCAVAKQSRFEVKWSMLYSAVTLPPTFTPLMKIRGVIFCALSNR
uniref:Uncharacterized protein n=1 Tax=Yersinia enterocolitica TaxID=630 RepID=B0RL32_YEREN|nr:hypothetical protein [Yersinia enterocolitica]